MAYRVFWTPYAEDQLSQLAAVSTDARQLAEAAREIDRRLISSPTAVGESRDHNFRVGFISPLAVHFEVMRDVQTVIVHYVWRTDGK